MTCLLDVRGLTKHFGGLRALEEVSFRIACGSIVSIIGPNGAGKTTLFNCLTGFARPTRGAVSFGDREIAGLPPYETVRLGLARTFQNIRLFREMTVLDNVLVPQHGRIRAGIAAAVLGLKAFRRDEEAARARGYEYLELVGLEEKVLSLAQDLPYGDQRRLEIARALAADPQLLLLDEPTAGMNPHETGAVMELIRKLRLLGKTVVLIEHDMKLVMGVSDAIIVLDHGVKIAEGTPAEIRNNPLVIEAYLGA